MREREREKVCVSEGEREKYKKQINYKEKKTHRFTGRESARKKELHSESQSKRKARA